MHVPIHFSCAATMSFPVLHMTIEFLVGRVVISTFKGFATDGALCDRLVDFLWHLWSSMYGCVISCVFFLSIVSCPRNYLILFLRSQSGMRLNCSHFNFGPNFESTFSTSGNHLRSLLVEMVLWFAPGAVWSLQQHGKLLRQARLRKSKWEDLI